MKKILIITSYILLIASCNREFYKFDFNKSPNPWTDAFKDRFFITALKEAYKKDTEIFTKIENLDAFNPYDGLNLEIRDYVDSIAIQFVNNIPSPLMCENCNKNEKYYMASILHYYKSKDLDIIAYKKYKKDLSK